MYDVKSMINEITSKKEINNISFTGCGGSLACFFAPHYYVTHESKKLTTVYENANEFANDTPANVGENSIVVCASRRGDTRQTVAAAKKAKEVGATVVGLQLETGTPLEEICDYIIQFKDTGVDGALYEESKGAYALKIAYELVNAVEHNDKKYEEMVAAMEKMNTIVPEAQKAVVPDAIKFSINYAKNEIIYTIGSGTAWAAAHQQTICIFMEMQWINSTGATRAVDERTLAFLGKFSEHTTVIDGFDYGMKELGEVSGYFDHSFYSEILGVYNHLLADRRQHPLSWRKYMWKYNY